MSYEDKTKISASLKHKRIKLIILLSVLLIAIDQYTKYLAKVHLRGEENISLMNGFLQLIYIENTGAFFGMGSGIPQPYNFILLSLIPIGILIALMVFLIRNVVSLSMLELITFVLIFSGGIGNIIDRVLFNTRVTDFLLVGIGSLRTGIFNVADMYVTFGVLVFLIFQRKNKDV